MRLRSGRERRRSGLFLAEGPREVERARAAGLRIVETFYAPALLDWDEGEAVERARAREDGLPRRAGGGDRGRRGAAARAAARRRRSTSSRSGSRSPGNLGAMARSAEAAGADALVVAEARADPWNPNAIRASTGAVFTLPVVEATLDEVARPRRRSSSRPSSTRRRGTPTPTSRAPSRSSSAPRTTGLAAPLARRRRRRASRSRSPHGSADSLNAATAAAILLFEAVRQRG